MKAILRISLGLNLVLLGCLAWVVMSQRRMEQDTARPVASVENRPVQTVAVPAPAVSQAQPEQARPFRWDQLLASMDYAVFVRNLRGAGCPEATIRDIVAGDLHRAFAAERRQLNLDESGAGPWSQQAETQMLAQLFGGRLAAAEPGSSQSAENSTDANVGGQTIVPERYAAVASTSCPLFLQSVNWSALGYNAGQQAAIAQARQQFLNQLNSPNPNSAGSGSQNAGSQTDSGSDDPETARHWHAAVQLADQQLRDELGAQGYMAYQLQQYYAWFQPQVMANVGGGTLAIGTYPGP